MFWADYIEHLINAESSANFGTGHSKWFWLTDLLEYENREFHGMCGLRKVSSDFGQMLLHD